VVSCQWSAVSALPASPGAPSARGTAAEAAEATSAKAPTSKPASVSPSSASAKDLEQEQEEEGMSYEEQNQYRDDDVADAANSLAFPSGLRAPVLPLSQHGFQRSHEASGGGFISWKSMSSEERVGRGTRVPTCQSFGIAGGFSAAFAGAVWGLAGRMPEGFVAPPDLAFLLPIFVVGYARANGLDHPTRLRIYNHLLVLPGDHFRSIVRSLRIGVGEGRHHLSVMLRSGLVREDRANGRCRYYAEGSGPLSDRNELFAKHWSYRDLRLRVLFSVRTLGEAKPSMVAKSLGISRQLAAYHLANLAVLGLVKRDGRRYRAS